MKILDVERKHVIYVTYWLPNGTYRIIKYSNNTSK